MRLVTTEEAPAAVGPYSQAVVAKGLVFGPVRAMVEVSALPKGVAVEMEARAHTSYTLPAAGGDMPVIVALLPSKAPFTCLEDASGGFWFKAHTDRHLRALATKVFEKCGLAEVPA